MDKETYEKRLWQQEAKPNSDGYIPYRPEYDEHYGNEEVSIGLPNKVLLKRKWKLRNKQK